MFPIDNIYFLAPNSSFPPNAEYCIETVVRIKLLYEFFLLILPYEIIFQLEYQIFYCVEVWHHISEYRNSYDLLWYSLKMSSTTRVEKSAPCCRSVSCARERYHLFYRVLEGRLLRWWQQRLSGMENPLWWWCELYTMLDTLSRTSLHTAMYRAWFASGIVLVPAFVVVCALN